MLGELSRKDMPVPPGFCLTIDAYKNHMREWNLAEELHPLLVRKEWTSASARAAAVFGESIAAGTLEALLSAYHCAPFRSVAVRSSATLEDLPDISFAGQQETTLHVSGDDTLIQALRRCWGSYWSVQALQYRHQHGVSHFSGAMGVLVQEMVNADFAGVLFTIDPTTHDHEHIVIQVARGLGHAVVSGNTTGDVYRVDRRSSLKTDHGDLSETKPLLADDLVSTLARMALRIESHLGLPQDIEFAVANGLVHVLQARPVTLPQVEPESMARALKLTALQRVTSDEADERYPFAPRPLDQLFFAAQIEATVYTLRLMGFAVSEQSERVAKETIWRDQYIAPQALPTWRLFHAAKLPMWALRRDWEEWWDTKHRAALLKMTAPVDLQHLTDRELLTRIDAFATAWRIALRERFPCLLGQVGEVLLAMLVTITVGPRRSKRMMADLKAGNQTETLKANAALWRVVESIRQSPDVAAAVREGDLVRLSRDTSGAAVMKEVEKFLEEFGHREGETWYLSSPTWGQDPTQLLLVASALAKGASPPGDGRDRYERACDELDHRLRHVSWIASRLHVLIERVRALERFRENSHWDLLRPLAALQAVAMECGRRLTDRGIILRETDVFYLTYPELVDWLNGSPPARDITLAHLRRRRVTYESVNARWQKRKSTQLLSHGQLKGQATSPGRTRGVARVILGKHEFHRLCPGEILVCHSTSPSWTPLFAIAAGVVTEIGGPLSHAAIVAREYSIPAVMGVRGATQLIADGTLLVVDGDTGRVWSHTIVEATERSLSAETAT